VTKDAEGLLLHLSKFPRALDYTRDKYGNIWNATGAYKHPVNGWFEEHEKLLEATVSQIRDAFDEGKNEYGHYWIYDGPDYARTRCEHVISLYEEKTIPKIKAKVLALLVSPLALSSKLGVPLRDTLGSASPTSDSRRVER